MATLSPAALVKSGQAGSSSSGTTVDPIRASTMRQSPMSPSSSSSRMPTDSAVIHVTGVGGADNTHPSPPPVRRVVSNDEFPAVDDLISKLPDVLFPFEGDTGDDELTPFKAVYGSSPSGGGVGHVGGGGSAGIHVDANLRDGGVYDGDFSFGGKSPTSPKVRLCFGSAPERHGENTFVGRGGSPGAASPPLDRPKRTSVSGGGGGKYQPPNRRDSTGVPFGSPPHRQHQLPPRNTRGKHGGGGAGQHVKPVKKNPVTPGFNGAGFRSIREIYVSKVHDFLCARAIEGSPWVKLSGKDGIAVLCEKPLTVPENYTQFFRDHASMFELSPDARYVAAKVPGEELSLIHI